ncbi:uncharacterized protein LOC117933891 [Vitis riparia]|uniref:uncharacterized protein LOC117933891 n=1 Tax=Vitis riparia TaxID=96939 RepID=UPI00155AF168|nr:uncharacterized protein LOC117933891 [Vitis riparia]
MYARLGPQTSHKNRPHATVLPEVRSEPSSSPTLQGYTARPPVGRSGKNPLHTAAPGFISRRLDDILSTPFSSRIIRYEPPRGFIVPKFSTYDGSNDPFDHVMHYCQLMTLDIGNDMLLCKVFPASLQGQALSWFHRLPVNSIDNFRDLSKVFVGQYLCSARHKQNISTLQNLKMQENETLREFVKRFGQAVLQVESYSMDAILQIFKRSISSGTTFFESLAKKPPTTMDELFRRASKYSMLEDDIHATTQQVLVTGQTAKSEVTKNFKAPNHPGSSSRGQEERRPSSVRTPLTISYEKLLPIIRNLPGFKWLVPIRSNPSERDRNKRCDYHKDHGHTTKMCISLRCMVEDLLKAGHLKQYIRTAPKGEQSSHSRGPHTPAAPIRAMINYIYGGLLDDEYNSKRKRQRLLRAATVLEHVNSIRSGLANGSIHPIDGTIVFPALDSARVLQPHQDAIILAIGVGNYDVKRTLIDPGSFADLLQVAVIKRMGFEPSSLENPGRTLSGFNGSSTTSLGDIILPIYAGPVILNILFSVVEDLSHFNAILGRTWLHGMKAIPSTYYHQRVSFITQDGQINLYRSQLAARQCYQIAREAGPSTNCEHPSKEASTSDQ